MRPTTTAFRIAISALLLPPSISSAEIHQCQINGRTVYQSIPCRGELGTISDAMEKRRIEEQAARERKAAEIRARQERERLRLAEEAHKEKLRAEAMATGIKWSAAITGIKQEDLRSRVESYEYQLSMHHLDSERVCTKEWTKRGTLDRRMFNHCTDQHFDSGKKLATLIADNNTSKYYPTALLYCFNEWTDRGISNVRMINHCMEQEVEGWSDIEYYKRRIDEAQVYNIALQGFMRYSSWRMAAYHLKRTLNLD